MLRWEAWAAAASVVTLAACGTGTATDAQSGGCSPDNAALIERLLYEGFSGGDMDVIEEVFHPDIRFEDPMFPSGLEGIKAVVRKNNAAMSDWRFMIDDMICDGDKASVRWHANGVHTGSFMGEPPTGEPVELRGIVIYEIEGGRIVTDWVMPDNLGFLMQLGVLSPVDMTQNLPAAEEE